MTIKLHLQSAEYDPIVRTAKAFGCDVEDVIYLAVDEYMSRLGNFEGQCTAECRRLHTDFESMRAEVINAKEARRNNLPLWADSAGSNHNYESFEPEQPHKSTKSAF
ncbi:MAG: hypothetical protein ACHQ4G_09050 [Opitutales bacterium]